MRICTPVARVSLLGDRTGWRKARSVALKRKTTTGQQFTRGERRTSDERVEVAAERRTRLSIERRKGSLRLLDGCGAERAALRLTARRGGSSRGLNNVQWPTASACCFWFFFCSDDRKNMNANRTIYDTSDRRPPAAARPRQILGHPHKIAV